MADFSFNDLSKSDVIKIMELVELTFNCSKHGDSKEILRRLGELVSFDKAAHSRVDSTNLNDFISITKSWPKEWQKRYDERSYAESDPIIQVGFRKKFVGVPLSWNEVYQIQQPNLTFLTEALDFGLVDGLATTWVAPGTTIVSMLSLSGKTEPNSRSKFILHKLMPYLHNSLSFAGASRLNLLTAREKEVLIVLSCGYSRSKTGIRLEPPISVHSVDQHCSDIMKKLGARNIVHAVKIAILMRLI